MDPNEIIKVAPEIAKGAAALGAAIPFTGIVKRMLGPAADELAEMWRDQIRVYRYERQLKCVEKAERMAQEAGFTPQAVPPKILFPLLEGASFEHDENLHHMWAALLANAANRDSNELVRPSFMDLLRIMTPDVAVLLNAAYDEAVRKIKSVVRKTQPKAISLADTLGIEMDDLEHHSEPDLIAEITGVTRADLGSYNHLFMLFSKSGCTTLPPQTVVASNSSPAILRQDVADRHRFAVAMDELGRMKMWNSDSGSAQKERHYLTAFAAQFVTVCRPPKPQK
jgi:hypothetical protein